MEHSKPSYSHIWRKKREKRKKRKRKHEWKNER